METSAQVQQLVDHVEQDRGADGLAATSRPSRIVVVLDDAPRSQFRDSGVEVLRYTTTVLDQMRDSRAITYDQYTAGRWAMALWRQAGISPQLSSRYEEWISGGRGSPVVDDSDDDDAAPWRELLASLPPRPAQALENMVMGCPRPGELFSLLEALSEIAAEQARTKRK